MNRHARVDRARTLESDRHLSKLSNLQRDYLAAIYQAGHIEAHADGQEPVVSTTELGDRMQASQSTVNRIVERLRSAGLIQHHRYVGVQLTARGEEEALKVLRKQSIVEAFLVHVLRFAWHEVYPEAQQLRHSVSPALLDRMWETSESPPRSPFGEWIVPRPPAAPPESRLIDAAIKRDYRIARVLTRQPDRLEYLAALGLTPGTPLHLLHKAPFSGPIQIQLAREYRIIGHELARMLTVIPAEAV